MKPTFLQRSAWQPVSFIAYAALVLVLSGCQSMAERDDAMSSSTGSRTHSVADATPAQTAAPSSTPSTVFNSVPQGAGPGPMLVLFGEVHDNVVQHARRLEWFRNHLAGGARPAVLLEMFDRDYQGDIDRLLKGGQPVTVDALIEAGSGAPVTAPGGWDWSLYRPLLALALEYRLPIIAANVSRTDARKIMQGGLDAHGFESDVPADIAAAQGLAIEESHCGLIDSPMAARMADAQIARDQFMARLMAEQTATGAVLIAGNGHVRRDIGVPRWMNPALRDKAEVVGMLEARKGESGPVPFDRVIVTPAQPRPDPCEAMRGMRVR